MRLPNHLKPYFKELKYPTNDSHKGQNGKLMIIGGAELFHAASRWSLDVASHFVDMVFYSSVPSNNEMIREAKGEFWNGIVVSRDDVLDYLDEADCILIGPGMTRTDDTAEITNILVKQYPKKKWVIDAGALQMIHPIHFNENMIVTPHPRELMMVLKKHQPKHREEDIQKRIQSASDEQLQKWCEALGGVTMVLKGKVDKVVTASLCLSIEGGNAGMTKGGTGDVLAGLIAAVACTNELLASAVIGSYTNKVAGDELYKEFGPFFNATELITQVPQTLWKLHELSEK
jgi:ADP-dependent NAD(P)H-hydrate dehydratase / NAD(P)H-hydrate epimerase